MTDALHQQSATELARRVTAREVSALEVTDAHLAQIDRVNPRVNAIVSLVPEMAREQARALDARIARGEAPGPLAGLPIAIKDLMATKGIRTTRGSLLFKDEVPDHDDILVEHLRAAGAIVIGKTNTPELGAGSQTFNAIFGATRNPYALEHTCGGSSGGAAAALAARMLPIADGSDHGGSLRNPAAFCNVVGFRPSPGLVSHGPVAMAYYPLSAYGPMARSVADLALMLSAIVGFDPRDPMSIPSDPAAFRAPLERDLRGVRIAWVEIPGMRFDRRVRAVVDAQRGTLEDLGCLVEDARLDLSEADEIFQTLRAFYYATTLGELVRDRRDEIKDTLVWNTEKGLALSVSELARAEKLRTQLFERVRRFMLSYEYFVLPTTQVPPFPLEQEYVTEIEGEKMETYIDWMRSCHFITVPGNPAISVPAGFTDEGLPVGMQIVGRHRQDLSVLQLAHAYEQRTGFAARVPECAL